MKVWVEKPLHRSTKTVEGNSAAESRYRTVRREKAQKEWKREKKIHKADRTTDAAGVITTEDPKGGDCTFEWGITKTEKRGS